MSQATFVGRAILSFALVAVLVAGCGGEDEAAQEQVRTRGLRVSADEPEWKRLVSDARTLIEELGAAAWAGELPDTMRRGLDEVTVTMTAADALLGSRTPATTTTARSLTAKLESHQAEISKWEEELKSVGDDAELANVLMQNKLQQQQQTLQCLSNVSKMLHDTAMAVIRKIG